MGVIQFLKSYLTIAKHFIAHQGLITRDIREESLDFQYDKTQRKRDHFIFNLIHFILYGSYWPDSDAITRHGARNISKLTCSSCCRAYTALISIYSFELSQSKMKPKFWAYLSSIPLTVIEVLILISPVKSQDNRLTESDGNAESSNGYIMPVGMFVLIFIECFY